MTGEIVKGSYHGDMPIVRITDIKAVDTLKRGVCLSSLMIVIFLLVGYYKNINSKKVEILFHFFAILFTR